MEPCKQITTCQRVNEKQSQESELKPKQQKTQRAQGLGGGLVEEKQNFPAQGELCPFVGVEEPGGDSHL